MALIKSIGVLLGTLLMFAAQVGPGDAASNLGKWAKLFGIDNVPAWLSSASADVYAYRIGLILVIFSVLLIFYPVLRLAKNWVGSLFGERIYASEIPPFVLQTPEKTERCAAGFFSMSRDDESQIATVSMEVDWNAVIWDWEPKKYISAAHISSREILFRQRLLYQLRPETVDVQWAIYKPLDS